ncbi:hypothetical protein [uncultured Methanobrevibacter sp.]|uniref:hypothetical protein n=1 Tax=uncultured Methanobrevibacter sp. TaxID=253161 RepID=UPI0025F4D2B6|nr:hypothetical protein [uncultured Methanobrevibacter sp.]
MANKVLRIILIIVIFIIFFEIGLVSSYTIVTSEAPNVQGLIDMQISKITGIFNPQKVNDMLIKDPTPVNITNKKDVALKMESLSQVDGVNVDSMNVSTYDNPDKNNFTVTIEALGYASPNSTSGQIVISKVPSYKIIAKGNATYKDTGLVVNEKSLVINSVLKLHNVNTENTAYTNYSSNNGNFNTSYTSYN